MSHSIGDASIHDVLEIFGQLPEIEPTLANSAWSPSALEPSSLEIIANQTNQGLPYSGETWAVGRMLPISYLSTSASSQSLDFDEADIQSFHHLVPDDGWAQSSPSRHGSPQYAASAGQQISLGRAVIRDSRDILRADYLEYLESMLPSCLFAGGGEGAAAICPPPEVRPSGVSDFQGLRLAYSAVCQLDTRMEADAIYSRIALMRLQLEYLRVHDRSQRREACGKRKRSTTGRGDATCIIDEIMRQLHPNWDSLSEARRRALRAKFHERKRYGKRWIILASGLSKGILLLCSPKVVAMVLKTSVTLKQLSGFVEYIRGHHHDLVELLELARPIGEKIYAGETCTSQEVAAVLEGAKLWGLRQT
ncbi:ATP-dependent DNA helicase PIF1 [Apiospora arundinis]|uniref:ATP-dependent DNA helicase PIF1 n=1 Tax=Apiospora arundinis TaxID=335852 RepID=A0ABR2IUD5_9PEZI